MKGFLLAQKILSKRVSNLSDKFSRQKSKCFSALSLIQTRLLSLQEETFFYIFPVRKSQNFKELLSPEELDRVRLKMQCVIEWQKQFEESSRISKQFSGNAKPKEEAKKASETVFSTSSFFTALRIPSYFSNISSVYLGTKNGPKTEKSPKVLNLQRRTETVSKAVVDATTRSLVEALDNQASLDSSYLKRLERLCIHLHAFPWAQGLAVREKSVGKILKIRDKSSNAAVKMQCDEALGLLGYSSPPRKRGIRILSIDGGGMRGLIALEILKAIEHYTGQRIHETFDLICGVSTGAIIASFLGFHKKSILEVEETYNTIGFKIFTQNILEGARGWVLNHSYYDTQAYENILKGFVGECRMIEAQRSPAGPKVTLVSTLVSGDRIAPFVFRSYALPYRTQSNYKGTSDAPIWAAVRASSAAPGYFNDFLLDDMVHQDGGILTNNATQIAIHEAHRIWPNERLQCVVSLGLGRFDGALYQDSKHDERGKNAAVLAEAKPLSLAQKFARIVDSATDTELVHETLHDLLPGRIYYRFNPYLTEYLSLDETRAEKFQLMRESTNMYLRRNESKVRDACEQLMLPRWPIDSIGDLVKHQYQKISSYRQFESKF